MNRNTKNKPMKIKQGDKEVNVQLSTMQDLEDGDFVSLTAGITFM